MRKGRSLVEVVFVVFIFMLIFTGFAYNYQRYLDQQRFNADFEQVVSIIRDAHLRTLSSRDEGGTGGRRYGMLIFNTNKSIELDFDLTPCTPSNCGHIGYDNPFTLTSTVGIASHNFPGAGALYSNRLFFERISGNAQVRLGANYYTITSPATIVIRSNRISGLEKTITIHPTGLLEIQ